MDETVNTEKHLNKIIWIILIIGFLFFATAFFIETRCVPVCLESSPSTVENEIRASFLNLECSCGKGEEPVKFINLFG